MTRRAADDRWVAGRAWRLLKAIHGDQVITVVTRHRRIRWRVSGDFGIIRDSIAALAKHARLQQRERHEQGIEG